MSKVQMIEAPLQTLSQSELRQVREWLDDLVEEDLEFTDEFEAKMQASEKDMEAGRWSRHDIGVTLTTAQKAAILHP
jgi:hypothetical protein